MTETKPSATGQHILLQKAVEPNWAFSMLGESLPLCRLYICIWTQRWWDLLQLGLICPEDIPSVGLWPVSVHFVNFSLTCSWFVFNSCVFLNHPSWSSQTATDVGNRHWGILSLDLILNLCGRCNASLVTRSIIIYSVWPKSIESPSFLSRPVSLFWGCFFKVMIPLNPNSFMRFCGPSWLLLLQGKGTKNRITLEL